MVWNKLPDTSSEKPGSEQCIHGMLLRAQDLLLQNTAPWHAEYFKLKEIQKTAEVGKYL
jgi:hypothetical protein